MKCPVCAHEFTIGQELLYKIEDIYYCPYCFTRITHWPYTDEEAKKKAEEKGEKEGPSSLDS